MKRISASLFLSFIASCSFNNKEIKEQELFDKVNSVAGKNNCQQMTEDEYDDVAKYISEGRSRWVDLYPLLMNKPFSGMTYFQEGLNISMAYALAENPTEVLQFVNVGNIHSICGMPFIEPEPQQLNAYYSKTRAAIIAVTPDLAWRDRCLSTLDRTLADRERFNTK